MAADRFLDTEGLRHLWEKIKAWIPFLSRKTQSIPFGQVDSTSTSTAFTATVDGIDELRDGVCCYIRNGVVTSATGCTMNINGLGAKPMYYTTSSTGRVTSHFNINYTWLFIYNSTRVAGGCWDSYWGYNSEYNLSQNYINIGRINVGDYPTSAYSLGAFDVNGKWTPFVTTATTSTGKSLVQSVFPIGAKIYRDSASRSNNTSYNDVCLHTTLSYSDLRYSSVNHNQAIFPNYNFNRVFMPVIVNVANNTFTLTTQTTNGYTNNFTNERSLKADNFYIEIGFNSASTTSYYLTLICENNLYYYDGEKLIEYSIYKSSIIDVPEYTIEKLASAETGYSSSYVLKKDNVQVGATINIPRDMVVSSGEVKTVTTANVPYQGAQVGDKYIDLTIANTAQNHIYIPVKDLVDVYVAGNGISISANNYISVKIDNNNANGLGVGGSGLALYQVTPSINGEGGLNGAMSATDKEKLDSIEAGAGVNHEYTIEQLLTPTAGYSKSYRLDKDGNSISGSATIDLPITPVTIEVSDMATIPSDTIAALKAGDVVVLNDRSQKYCFITSFKSNGICCMTYTDNEVIQTVVYTYSSVWAYDDTYTNEVFGNKVFLNGYTDTYGVFPYSLAAFAIAGNGDAMTMTSFTTTGGTSAKAAITTMWFPIGSKIYYYDNSTALSASTDFTSEMFYATHKNVDARYTAITGSNVSLGYMNYSAVFLRVDVNANGYWRPYYDQISGVGTNQENIVTIDDLVQGGYYIYLGRTVGTSGHAFQLEDNNPLYYYDGKSLQKWSQHIAEQYYVSVLTELGNYYTKSQTYSQSEVDALINGVSNFEYVVIESPNTLPPASSATMGKMYIYNGHRYVTVYSNNTYSWHDLGSYDIDLTDYVTETELQQALADVVTTQDLTDYVTETELQRELNGYATLTYLNYYPTKLELNDELADRPIFQKVTEDEMQYMLDHNTWVKGVLYYTEED